MQFRPLFTVDISHAYYSGGCRDFSFLVPAGTQETLRSGRLLVREREGVLHVLYEADGGGGSGVPVSSIAGKILYFGLRLNNPYFGNFSESVITDADLTPFYANNDASTALDSVDGMQLAAGIYAYMPQESARPVTLTLADSQGNPVATQVLVATGESAAFDLRALPGGFWRMTEDYGGGLVRTRTLLLDADLRDAGVWGVVAINMDAAFYAAPAVFTIPFTPRQETLQYYIVASRFGATEFDQLTVKDAGFTDEARAEIKFDKVLPAAFSSSDFSPSLLGDDSTRIVLFQSQTPVARKERGLRKIHLQRNGDILIEHLPQPGVDRNQAQLIIHLSKP